MIQKVSEAVGTPTTVEKCLRQGYVLAPLLLNSVFAAFISVAYG